MKKQVRHAKTVKKAAAKKTTATNGPYLVYVRGWMFFVMVALMLGLGLVVGNYLNQSLNGPMVAGAQVELR